MTEHIGSTRPNGSPTVALAWLAVVAGVVGNTIASFVLPPIGVHLALGALTAVGVVTLVLHWLHRR